VNEGHGVKRYPVMYNDFVLIGPKDDPAKIAGGKDIVEAFRKIQATQAPFVSRGDRSGTHVAELDLWTLAGIDLEKVVTLPAKSQIAMARIYKNTDCGLFPNRCEGGTNLALMEYMACGKPAIVSNSSGHRDVADDGNALLLKNLQPLTVPMGGHATAVWDEPSLDEAIEALEWAYQHREALREIGEAVILADEMKRQPPSA